MQLETVLIDKQLFELVSGLVQYGVDLVHTSNEVRRFFQPYNRWPVMYVSGNGLPTFSTSWAPAINYTSSIKVVGYPPFPRLAAFSTLIDYVQVQPRLKAYYIDARPGLKEFLDSSKQRSVKEWLISPLSEIVAELVSRYVYTYPDAPFSREHLLSLYSPMEAGLFQESLPAEIVVPILFVRFDFDRLEIGPDARIERLDDNFQLARMFSPVLNEEAHSIAIGAATHALVLTNVSMPNQYYGQVRQSAYNPDWYPRERIDKFFAAFRIVTGLNTGYAQLLMRPIGWVHEYVADLPLVEGTSVREYKLPLSAFWRAYTAPDSDELKPAPLSPLLTIETSEKTGRTFTQLLSLNNDRVALASKRLNFCMLRIKEEDAILDAIIAMEAILSDESTTEVIHKLASRMAALTQLAGANNMQPVEVFHEVKKIYDYRSGVVHGNKKKVEKNRELTRHSGSKIRSLQAAIEYLRLALTILIDNPEYLSATKIDEELLLGKLGSQPVAANS